MNVYPTRARAVEALEARRGELLMQNRPDEAAQVQSDLALIRKAPGEDLYAMTQQAQDRAERLGNSLLARDARAGWPCGPIGMGLGLLGGLVAGGTAMAIASALGAGPAVTALAAVGTGVPGMMAAFLPDLVYNRAEQARKTVEALDRQYAYIDAYQKPAGQGVLPLQGFLRLAHAREADLLRQGVPSQAADLRRVSATLERLPCDTLEEAFQHLLATDDPVLKVLERSPEVLGLVQSMAEVQQLGQGSTGSVEVQKDAIRIGGVVLRRKA